MKIIHELLPSTFVIQNGVFEDQRGAFTKYFSPELHALLGEEFNIIEQFVSTSKRNVLRGMHLQTPPFAYKKMVTCLTGEALDVVVDLRRHSPSFGRAASVELKGGSGISVYIPIGVAHGFLALSDHTSLLYSTDQPHEKEHDTGVHWNSFGFKWPLTEDPIVSARDSDLPSLKSFPYEL